MKKLHEKTVSELDIHIEDTIYTGAIHTDQLKKWAASIVKDMKKRDDLGADIDGYVAIRCFLIYRFELTEDDINDDRENTKGK